jgi:hypothetical protein
VSTTAVAASLSSTVTQNMCGQYGIFSQLLKLKFVKCMKQNQNRLAVEKYSIPKYEVVGRTNELLSFDMIWNAPKMKKLRGIHRDSKVIS